MKTTVFLFLLMMAAAALLTGCAGTIEPQPIAPARFVDVYINEECMPSTLAKGSLIENIWVFPGDFVVFTNTRDKKLEIKFPVGMFDKESAVLEPGKRVVLKVMDVEPKIGAITLVGEICPDGIPKVKVGEEP